MSSTQRAIYCLLLSLTLVSCALPGFSESLHVKKQRETIRVRLVAREAPIAASAFSQNVDSYLIELVDKGGEHLARLSFRFLPYESPIPEELRDYAIVHTFRATRDRNCDASAAQLAAQPLQYSTDAPQIRVMKPASALPCYVVTANDYKGSKRDRNTNVVRDESKSDGSGLLAKRQ
jgi:hypothetical protein